MTPIVIKFLGSDYEFPADFNGPLRNDAPSSDCVFLSTDGYVRVRIQAETVYTPPPGYNGDPYMMPFSEPSPAVPQQPLIPQ